MATIPSAARLDRALPQDQQAIVQMDTRNADYGLRDLGQAIANTGNTLNKVELVNRQAAMDDADLEMAIALEKEQAAYDQDPDYATILNRADESMIKARDTLAGVVDPRDRALWEKQQDLKIERARNTLKKVAWVKERDHERGRFETQMDQAREAALTSRNPDALLEFADLQRNRTETMVAKGYMTAEEKAAADEKYAESLAMGRLRMMEPEDRIAALKEPWAKNIPIDQRAVLEREARSEQVKIQAIDIVDAIPPGTSRWDAQAQIDKIKDPRQRMAAEDRLRSVMASRDQAEAEQQSDAYRDQYNFIRNGGKFEDIPENQLSELSPAMQANLKASAEQVIKPRTTSDRNAFAVANSLAKQGNWGSLNQFLMSNGSNLSETDFKKFTDAVDNATAPPSVTLSEAIDGTLPGKDNADLRKTLLLSMNTWQQEWIASTGSAPRQDEIVKEINRRTAELVNEEGKAGYFEFGEKPIHDMDVEPQQRAMLLDQVTREEMRKKNPGAYDTLPDYMRSQGLDPNDRYQAQAVWENRQAVYHLVNSPEPHIMEMVKAVDNILGVTRPDDAIPESGPVMVSDEKWLMEFEKLRMYERSQVE
jgi:hypothetical protein